MIFPPAALNRPIIDRPENRNTSKPPTTAKIANPIAGIPKLYPNPPNDR
jgi:hypothetical protein